MQENRAMLFSSWFSNRFRRSPRPTPRNSTSATQLMIRPRLEALEERWRPSTLTVLNAKDSGAGSLRAAIAAAHNGDTINFAAGLIGQTIALSSGELLIKHNVTIVGPGADKLTISGSNASRVFEL